MMLTSLDKEPLVCVHDQRMVSGKRCNTMRIASLLYQCRTLFFFII